jgi:hypothetical protein
MSKQEQFIEQIKNIKNYWLSVPDKTTEEVIDGVLFSILVMIDGDSGINDFHALEIIDTEDEQHIDCGYLHEVYNYDR